MHKIQFSFHIHMRYLTLNSMFYTTSLLCVTILEPGKTPQKTS